MIGSKWRQGSVIQFYNHEERRKDEEKLFRFCFRKNLLIKLEDISIQFVMKLDIEVEIFGVAVEQFKRAEEKVLNEFVTDRAAESACLQIVKK